MSDEEKSEYTLVCTEWNENTTNNTQLNWISQHALLLKPCVNLGHDRALLSHVRAFSNSGAESRPPLAQTYRHWLDDAPPIASERTAPATAAVSHYWLLVICQYVLHIYWTSFKFLLFLFSHGFFSFFPNKQFIFIFPQIWGTFFFINTISNIVIIEKYIKYVYYRLEVIYMPTKIILIIIYWNCYKYE